MKKVILVALLALANSAFAQSQVTVYGTLDAGVRRDASASSDGSPQTRFISGGQSTSNIGFKGVEDLGNGKAASFAVEGGLSLGTGAPAQSGSTGTITFDRKAYVGLRDSSYGEIQLGRNTNAAYDFAAEGITNPLALAMDGVGAPSVTNGSAARINQTLTVVSGTNSFKTPRSDGMVKYINQIGDATVIAGYSLGGQVDDATAKGSWNVGVKYNLGPVAVATSILTAIDANGNALKMASTGGRAQLTDSTSVTAGYHTVRTDASYVPANLTTTATAQTILGGVANTEVDVATVGATYQFTPKFSSTVAYYAGTYKNLAQAGKLDTYVLWNQYELSKRTNLYAELDYGRASDDMAGPGLSSSNIGVMTGIRHQF